MKLKPPVIPEQGLHEQVKRALDILLLPPAIWACYPAGHLDLTPAQAARLVRSGLRRGMPDFLLWAAGASYGIELKRPGGQLSERQRIMFPLLRDAGMSIGICHSLDEVLDQLRGWGLPLRPYR